MKTKKIMLVDDDPDIHDLVKIVAEMNDYNFISFFDPHSALRHLQSNSVDLVVLDLCFNEPHDGSLFINEVAKTARDGALVQPILILSRQPNRDVVDYVKELGATGYLKKPVTLEQLAQAIFECLKIPTEAVSQHLANVIQIDS